MGSTPIGHFIKVNKRKDIKVKEIEKKIAEAILETIERYEATYTTNKGSTFGEYAGDQSTILREVCKEKGLPYNLWVVLNLAMHWRNDLLDWSETILLGKDFDEVCIGAVKKEPTKTKPTKPSKHE